MSSLPVYFQIAGVLVMIAFLGLLGDAFDHFLESIKTEQRKKYIKENSYGNLLWNGKEWEANNNEERVSIPITKVDVPKPIPRPQGFAAPDPVQIEDAIDAAVINEARALRERTTANRDLGHFMDFVFARDANEMSISPKDEPVQITRCKNANHDINPHTLRCRKCRMTVRTITAEDYRPCNPPPTVSFSAPYEPPDPIDYDFD